MKSVCASFYNSDKDIATYPVEWKRGPNNVRSLKLSVPLSIDGLVQEGFSLIGNTMVDTPERHVTFILNYSDPSGFERGLHVAKAEWKPISGHNNKGWGPDNLRYMEQVKSHCHCFNDNAGLPGDIWKNSRLPVALPIDPEPLTFEEFLDFIGKKFRILKVSLIPTPPWDTEWQPELF